MSLLIYRRGASNGARSLVQSIEGAKRAKSEDSLARHLLRHRVPVVCWGDHLPPIDGAIRTLNNVPSRTKFDDAVTLRTIGVPTVEVSRTAPPPIDYPPLVIPVLERTVRSREEAEDLMRVAADIHSQFVHWDEERPVPIQWLPRLNYHVGGGDLLSPPTEPDYWVKKENLIAEFRVHSFLGASIRAGKKVPIEGDPLRPPHSWIRSLQSGWKISYDGVSVRQLHRNLAHSAVSALGLDFGAVDLGLRDDGSLIVLEVNRAPGLDGGTITAYATAIKRWADEGERTPENPR